jgi:predicted RNA binding protein YcfA (HicA-like mRNA interferase family)
MAPLIPGITYREAQTIIELLGWAFDSQRGSHVAFTHPKRPGEKITITNHLGDINPATMGSVVEQMGLSRADFLRLRGQGRRRYARNLRARLGL